MSEVKNEKKLQFVADAIYNGAVAHKKGEVKVLDNSIGMADRWIKRGVAIIAKDEVKPVEVKESVKEVVKESFKPLKPANNKPVIKTIVEESSTVNNKEQDL